MTRDEIISMAREAGCGWTRNGTEPLLTGEEQIQRFADLVAAAERTRLHDKFMQIHKSQQHSNNYWHFAARKIKEEA